MGGTTLSLNSRSLGIQAQREEGTEKTYFDPQEARKLIDASDGDVLVEDGR